MKYSILSIISIDIRVFNPNFDFSNINFTFPVRYFWSNHYFDKSKAITAFASEPNDFDPNRPANDELTSIIKTRV